MLGKGARAGEGTVEDGEGMLYLWFWGDLGLVSGGLVGPWPLLNTFCHFFMFIIGMEAKVRVSKEGSSRVAVTNGCGRRHEGAYVFGGNDRGDV